MRSGAVAAYDPRRSSDDVARTRRSHRSTTVDGRRPIERDKLGGDLVHHGLQSGRHVRPDASSDPATNTLCAFCRAIVRSSEQPLRILPPFENGHRVALLLDRRDDINAEYPSSTMPWTQDVAVSVSSFRHARWSTAVRRGFADSASEDRDCLRHPARSIPENIEQSLLHYRICRTAAFDAASVQLSRRSTTSRLDTRLCWTQALSSTRPACCGVVATRQDINKA